MQAGMTDPSYGVPAQLLPHVHLISGQKYPFSPQLNIDAAYGYLFEAPKVVKQMAPMSWQYIQAPQDGTVFLTWIGGRMQNQFPTDGYVWVDPEQRYTQDFGGYTLEIAVHNSGYRPGVDAVTSHARRRYRFMSKNPSIHALPPDPSLWIVHYCQADAQHCFPASQLPVSHQSRQQLAERQWIESQGRLERQDFMLHDREKWPQLNMPGRGGVPGAPAYGQNMYQQNPMAHIGNARFSGNFYQQAQQPHVGPSPAKRQRQHAPAHIPASAAALMAQDTSIEDEENVLLGDLLDHLTQRDISLTRYMQHHEWMEEIFSSPYATGQIVPMDLGFGLMGELAGLTEGLFDLPTSSEQDKAASKDKDKPAAYKKVSPDQLQEFEKRVQAHKEKEQADIKRMTDEHARRMDSLRKSKSLVKAEKKLRNASWTPSESGTEFWRLEKTNDQDANQIIHHVEELLGGSIKSQKEATMIEEGGFRPEEKKPAPAPEDPMGMQLDGAGLDANQSIQSASGAPAEPSLQAEQNQQPTQQPPAPQAPQPQSETGAPSVPDTTMENLESMDTGNFSLPDDMELDTSNFNFDTPKADIPTPGAGNWPSQHQQPQAQPQQASANSQPDTSNQQSGNDMYGAEDTGFGDFDTGDGLIDFEGGAGGDLDFSMDNSAFGDAFHGTEPHQGQDEGSGEGQ